MISPESINPNWKDHHFDDYFRKIQFGIAGELPADMTYRQWNREVQALANIHACFDTPIKMYVWAGDRMLELIKKFDDYSAKSLKTCRSSVKNSPTKEDLLPKQEQQTLI